MPENIQNAERMLLNAAQTAIKLRELDTIEKPQGRPLHQPGRHGAAQGVQVRHRTAQAGRVPERHPGDQPGDAVRVRDVSKKYRAYARYFFAAICKF